MVCSFRCPGQARKSMKPGQAMAGAPVLTSPPGVFNLPPKSRSANSMKGLTMRFDKFTLKVQEALQEAQGRAGKYGPQALDAEHLLFSFLKQPEGIASEILRKLGSDPRRIEGELRKTMEILPKVEGGGGQTYIPPSLTRIPDP